MLAIVTSKRQAARFRMPQGPVSMRHASWQADGLRVWIPKIWNNEFRDHGPDNLPLIVHNPNPVGSNDPNFGSFHGPVSEGCHEIDGWDLSQDSPAIGSIEVANFPFLAEFTLCYVAHEPITQGAVYVSAISRGSVFDASSNFAFGVRNSTQNPFLYARNSANDLLGIEGGGAFTNANSHRMVGCWKSGDQRIYQDGTLQASDTDANGDDGSQSLYFGRATSGSESSWDGPMADSRVYDYSWDVDGVKMYHEAPYDLWQPSRAKRIFIPEAGASAAITGTAEPSITEAEVTAGGETIIITLTGDTFVAAGTGPIGSTADTQALIDGISAATSPALGWNAEWRDKEVTTAVARTSATVATITMSSQATISGSFDNTAQETVTVTIPAAVLTTSASPIVAAPTFTVEPTASSIAPQAGVHMNRLHYG